MQPWKTKLDFTPHSDHARLILTAHKELASVYWCGFQKLVSHQRMPQTRSSKHIGASPQATSHFQDGPRLGNQFTEDNFLQQTIRRLACDEPTINKAEEELTGLGNRSVYTMLPLARQLNKLECQPVLQQYDAWGQRIDEIATHPAWKAMHGFAAMEGVIADGYDAKKWGRDARLVQFSKLFLYAPSSGLYSCPLAMTDGAVRYLKLALGQDVPQVEAAAVASNMGDTFTNNAELRKDAQRILGRLLSRNPDEFYTSGQWMTERGGGSDVAQGTETIARKLPDGTYALYGYKWFTSATDADVALTLARIESENGDVLEGSGGLSCFLVYVRNPETKRLNNIRVHRLKNKLGTKQLPTAEMELCGTIARLVSVPGRGVASITTGMVNITRMHNAISACASIRRMTALARDYSHRRQVFGAKLSENRLHLRTLSALELHYRSCLALTMDMVSILGRVDTSMSSKDMLGGSGVAGSCLTVEAALNLVRLMTPIVKAYTAKVAVSCASEGVETFGGQGYIEDSGLPVILRDAQVLPIWEGTTNVLSMDTLRVLSKSKFAALFELEKVVRERCNTSSSNPLLKAACESVLQAMDNLSKFLKTNFAKSTAIEVVARELTMSIGRVAAGSCLIEHASWTRDVVDAAAAKRFCCEAPLLTLQQPLDESVDLDRILALDIDLQTGKARGFGDIDFQGKLRAKF